MVEKRLRRSEVGGVKEGELQVVDGLKCCGRRVVDGTRGCFKDGEDVSFELVDECGSGVEVGCAK